jgi:hypothetical protein
VPTLDPTPPEVRPDWMPRWLKPHGAFREEFRRSPGGMLIFLILMPVIAGTMTASPRFLGPK